MWKLGEKYFGPVRQKPGNPASSRQQNLRLTVNQLLNPACEEESRTTIPRREMGGWPVQVSVRESVPYFLYFKQRVFCLIFVALPGNIYFYVFFHVEMDTFLADRYSTKNFALENYSISYTENFSRVARPPSFPFV